MEHVRIERTGRRFGDSLGGIGAPTTDRGAAVQRASLIAMGRAQRVTCRAVSTDAVDSE
jgi:hypothetical protein